MNFVALVHDEDDIAAGFLFVLEYLREFKGEVVREAKYLL